jgi:hypothetical protein
MKVANQIPDTRMRTTIPFEGNERDQFRQFVKANGFKVGGYLRMLVLREMKTTKTGGAE